MTKTFRRFAAVTAIAAVTLALPAAGARAAESDADVADGPKTLAKYMGCAIGLSLPRDVGSGIAAFFNCVRIFLDEFPS